MDWLDIGTMYQEALKYERRRDEMVRRQVEKRGIADPRVLAAMRKVPRHLFVSEALRDQAYSDYPLPIGSQQTISQPFMVAQMTAALELTREDRVLEIGTGSGYQAAVLANIVYRVYTVERIRSLYNTARKLFDALQYHNIVTKYSDGTTGWKDECPFDAIVVTAGAPRIPDNLVAQLASGGRMIMPVGCSSSQELIRIDKDGHTIRQTKLGGCRFVKLVGDCEWKGP